MTLSNATPLIALDAVAIDTETTGLDPRTAWIVEVGAVRLVGGRLQPSACLRHLVRPGEPIPPQVTQIHGIDNATVAKAPRFADIWPELSACLNSAVVIGHALGFDMAVLKRECERAGLTWMPPRTLDTRLLAEVAAPDLPDYSLESLSRWLGVELTQRHSALGDALTAARIFIALVPKLRDRGIRTLSEAERACRALGSVLEEHRRAGWAAPAEAPNRADMERTFSRIDSYPYRHRVRDIMRTPAQFIAADKTVREALERMMREQISSLYVRSPSADESAVQASAVGIVTERDLLRAFARHGAQAFDLPVERLMSAPLSVVPADAFVYRAIGRMSRLKVRHLGAVDDAGFVIGALSARDLLRLRASEAITLGDEIDQAEDAPALAIAWAKLPRVAAALLAEGLSGREIAAVISREIGALTRQAAVIAEARMQKEGYGPPPCAYAVAVLGSAGRGESLLAMDQDNALFFVDGEPGSSTDCWFKTFGTHIADLLHEAGVPYCKGGVMARSPQWRGSVSTWRDRIRHWIERSDPQDLLAVDIFFDLRGVHGDLKLAHSLWREAFEAAQGQATFAKLLADAAGAMEPGLNFFGGFRTTQGRIDLKKTGLFGIVTTARTLAICHHVVARSTPERLAGIKALGIGGERDLDALIDAHRVFLDLMLSQQIEDIEHGTPPSNAVAVRRLSKVDRDRLYAALRSVEQLDQLTRDLLFRS